MCNCGGKVLLFILYILWKVVDVSFCDEVEFASLSSRSIHLVNKNLPEKTRFTRRAETVVFDERASCLPGRPQPRNRMDTNDRVTLLRERMAEKNFDALIVPSEDEHQNEYVAPSDQRREFVTGFTGSAGVAVVTQTDQVLWTDTRYNLQAQQQMDCQWKLVTERANTPAPADWLSSNLAVGASVAADGRLFGAEQWQETEKRLKESNITFVDSGTILDDVWLEFGRPKQNENPVFVHDLMYAGKTWQEKVTNVRHLMEFHFADLIVVTALDEVAWLLNLRGSDIPYNAVFRSYVVLEANSSNPVHVFLQNPDNVTAEVKKHLGIGICLPEGECAEIRPYDEIKSFLENISRRDDIHRILLSKEHPYHTGVSYHILSSIPEHKRYIATSPILLTKAKKDAKEAAAMKEAQLKDAVALVEFFAFLENEIVNGHEWDELSATIPLRNFRKQQPGFRGDSFEPISSFGSNGAIIHYSPTEDTKAVINNQSLYLLDSGGQYLDGTTDVTRTLHFGTPSPFQIEAYTRVLKGSIDLATLIFPKNIKDVFVDILARRPLYEAGLEYGHGTGHGVGLFLNVHEGPTLIAMREKMTSLLEAGHFFSDEPGYYKDGEFGIRLESLLHVIPHPTLNDSYGEAMLQFDMVTLVPFEPKLIDVSLLDWKQCDFLNNYNKRVRDVIGKRLQNKGKAMPYDWMESKTRQIDCSLTNGNLRQIKSSDGTTTFPGLEKLC